MLVIKQYNRKNAVEYAMKWALGRNPLFFNFTGLGGDCTNYVSQCILAGSCEMNYDTVNGWYYRNADERSPSWAGVSFFYDFIIYNQGVGPYAEEAHPDGLLPGDVIQLGRGNEMFYHTLFVTGYQEDTYLVSAHTDDALNRRLDTYHYTYIRFIHILGVRLEIQDEETCFRNLMNGEKAVDVNAEKTVDISE